MSIWIPIGLASALVAFGIIRSAALGKREARRLEALFTHVASCQCPACGVVYGVDVKPRIEWIVDGEDALPAGLAGNRSINTWRVPCAKCGVVSLLAEDYPVTCEFLKARA